MHPDDSVADASNVDVANDRTRIPELPATYANIKGALEKILSMARDGTYVYIHYSGHGQRMEASSQYSSRTTGDLTLSFLEAEDTIDMKSFPGLELAKILKAMVDNGMIVTLVLDCCFSGCVLRHRGGLKHNATLLREYDPNVTSVSHATDMNYDSRKGIFRNGKYRDASMLPNWLIRPEGYTVITACGPQEIARELSFPGQSYRHGALSYFILRAIEKLGGLGGKHAHIYPYLCSMFHQHHPMQNPMWFGNTELYFFGEKASSIGLAAVPYSVFWNGSCLKLQGGQAHGVCEGDEFAVYTIGVERPLLTSKASNVGPLTSDLCVPEPQGFRKKKGFMAKALTHLSLRCYPIEIGLSDTCLGDWQTALGNRENLVFRNSEHPYALHISSNEAGDSYQIRDICGREEASGILRDLEFEKIKNSPGQVLDIVERLVKFKMVGSLTNKWNPTALEEQYQVDLLNPTGEAYQPGAVVSVEEGDQLRLVVQNHSSSPLYLHIYNLAPLGNIKNTLWASYAVVPSENRQNGFRGQWVHRLKTMVPSDPSLDAVDSCEDIIKVFLTTHPTSFASLEMQEFKDIRDHGTVEPGQTEEPPLSGAEDWVALNFRIITHKNRRF
ncbi:hypothetical protein F5Y08DRAFT_321378 [Xylaria arbuscula]|nr:hypothetical protein F5Y08DRAFT_321378 [Xylaria arbuscula]